MVNWKEFLFYFYFCVVVVCAGYRFTVSFVFQMSTIRPRWSVCALVWSAYFYASCTWSYFRWKIVWHSIEQKKKMLLLWRIFLSWVSFCVSEFVENLSTRRHSTQFHQRNEFSRTIQFSSATMKQFWMQWIMNGTLFLVSRFRLFVSLGIALIKFMRVSRSNFRFWRSRSSSFRQHKMIQQRYSLSLFISLRTQSVSSAMRWKKATERKREKSEEIKWNGFLLFSLSHSLFLSFQFYCLDQFVRCLTLWHVRRVKNAVCRIKCSMIERDDLNNL